MGEVGYKKPPKKNCFVKGDPRINRNGRPKSFDAFRALGQAIASETVAVAAKKLGASNPKPELAKLTVAEMILRSWAFSKDARLQLAFTEVAFGKVPQPKESEVNNDELSRLAAILGQTLVSIAGAGRTASNDSSVQE